MDSLPQIMVAPNGARRKKSDHPAIPVTIAEIVETARACFAAGAGGIHAHVRDENQNHVLDAGLYRELISEMRQQVSEMTVQITTEAVGRYSPAQQRQLVRDVQPRAVSVGLCEMLSDNKRKTARNFYSWAFETGVDVQHILYAPEEVAQFHELIDGGVIPEMNHQLMLVLGRYSKDQQSDPSDLMPFLEALARRGGCPDWAICAFGVKETACLAAAIRAGGKVRVGFENSIWNADGTIAKDNAERVSAIRDLIGSG